MYVALGNHELSQRIDLATITDNNNPAGSNNVLTKWNVFWSDANFTGPAGNLKAGADGSIRLGLKKL